MIYCTATESQGRETIYEFMPLAGDPTPEELKAARKARYKKRVESQKATLQKLVEKGIVKLPKKKTDSHKNG